MYGPVAMVLSRVVEEEETPCPTAPAGVHRMHRSAMGCTGVHPGALGDPVHQGASGCTEVHQRVPACIEVPWGGHSEFFPDFSSPVHLA